MNSKKTVWDRTGLVSGARDILESIPDVSKKLNCIVTHCLEQNHKLGRCVVGQ